MTSPIATSQIAVLDAVVRRLVDVQIGLTESTCYVCGSDELKEHESQHNVWVTVWPGGGGLNPELSECIGDDTIGEDAWTAVTIWSAVKLDRRNHDRKMLDERDRGVLELKRRILKALVNHRLLNTSGDQLLVVSNITTVQTATPSVFREGHVRGLVELQFFTPFLWDLS